MRKFKTELQLFILAGALLLLSIIMGWLSQAAVTLEAPRFVGVGLEYGAYFLTLCGVLASLTGLGFLVFKLIKGAVTDVQKATPIQPEEARPIQDAMMRLTTLLSQLEPNVQEADVRLADAREWTDTLVKMVLAVVDRIEQMEHQAACLKEALDAVNSGKREQVALTAGRVSDPALRQILRSPYVVKREDFRVETVTIISGEIGTLEQWARSYSQFVTSLITQIALTRDRAAALQAGRAMLEASAPILQIQLSLGRAADALQLRAQPSLRFTARQALPAPIIHLLD